MGLTDVSYNYILAIFATTLLQSKQRKLLITKSLQDWFLDGIGLCFQGAIIPLLQIGIATHLYQKNLTTEPRMSNH